MTDVTMANDRLDLAGPDDPRLSDYFALMKPRVMSLVIFTGLVGLCTAPVTPPSIVAFASILCIAIGAGASGALNMWWEADLDARMGRTQNRPIPSGRVTRDEALGIGLFLAILSVAMLAVFANPFAALLLAGTIAFYGGFYTIWLKPRTPQNIVIGGAAGAIPPVIGWVAATGSLSIEPLLMFAIIFLWTPPHFWALALWKRREYATAEIPMLPVVAGPEATRRQVMAYSIVLAVAAVSLIFTDAAGPIYALVAVSANAVLLWRAWQVARRDESAALAERYAPEKRLFAYSLTYLAALFAALLGDVALSGILERLA